MSPIVSLKDRWLEQATAHVPDPVWEKISHTPLDAGGGGKTSLPMVLLCHQWSTFEPNGETQTVQCVEKGRVSRNTFPQCEDYAPPLLIKEFQSWA